MFGVKTSVYIKQRVIDGEFLFVEKEKRYNNIKISGLHNSICEQDLYTLFGNMGNIVYVKLFYSIGIGVVFFDDAESANRAIKSMNGVIGKGKPLKIQLLNDDIDDNDIKIDKSNATVKEDNIGLGCSKIMLLKCISKYYLLTNDNKGINFPKENSRDYLFFGLNCGYSTRLIYLLLGNFDTKKIADDLNIYNLNNDFSSILSLITYVNESTFGNDEELNIITKNYSSIFYKSCYLGQINIVKLLVSINGIDINEPSKNKNGDIDFNGNNGLIVAASNGHLKIVKYLLSLPIIDVNVSNNDGNTALSFAIRYGKDDIAKLLINSPDINVNKTTAGGHFYLLVAISYSRIDIIKLLLSLPNIDINKANYDGVTALMAACNRGSIEILKLLMAHPGIDVKKLSKDGKTAKDYIDKEISNDYIEIIQIIENKI